MRDTIINSFDIWSDAQGIKSRIRVKSVDNISLEGIAFLRKLIQELAVCGRLVPQDSKEEPAIELIKQIEIAKKQLIKDGKLKSQNIYPEITDKERTFKLPIGWEFARFGNVTFNKDSERIPLSVEERSIRKGEYDYYGASGVIDQIDSFIFDKPLLLIGEDGANLVNRSTPIAFIAKGKYWVNNHAHVIDGLTEEYLRFICLHVNAISLLPYITGTAQPKMNQAKMNSIVLAIPPLVEQNRILAKVDELMALCDKLEAEQFNNLKTHQALVKTLLETLTQAADADELKAAWERLSAHFNILFCTDDSIDQLKQTILQLAVMGKLVKQDPNDEPASELIKKIAKEKEKLIKEGKLKKQNPLPEIKEDEMPFALPNGWKWSYLADLLALVTDGDHQAPPQTDTGVPFLVIGNLNTGRIIIENCKYVPVSYFEGLDWSRKPVQGDILYTVTGSYGISIPVESNHLFCVQRHVAILKSAKLTPQKYLLLALGSKYAFNYATEIATGIAQKTVPLTGLRKMLIPIPPITEQHRIITKINELFTICDSLRNRIQKSQNIKVLLSKTIVEKAVS